MKKVVAMVLSLVMAFGLMGGCGQKDRVIMQEWYTPELVGKFGSGPAILKAGLKARGIPAGHVRAPLRDVSAADARQIHHTLDQLGCIASPRSQAMA